MSPRPRPRSRSAPPIVVRDSSIQGLGVFATRPIARGERILEYVGERITNAEADRRYDDASMARHHTFLFMVDDDTCIDGNVGGDDGRFINHSCAPNAYSLSDDGRIFIVAGRAIATDEEILYDYAYPMEPGETRESVLRAYPCRCGAATCRGTLADLPKERAPKKPKRAPAAEKKRAVTTRATGTRRRGT